MQGGFIVSESSFRRFVERTLFPAVGIQIGIPDRDVRVPVFP